jgi:hypothetical protein
LPSALAFPENFQTTGSNIKTEKKWETRERESFSSENLNVLSKQNQNPIIFTTFLLIRFSQSQNEHAGLTRLPLLSAKLCRAICIYEI